MPSGTDDRDKTEDIRIPTTCWCWSTFASPLIAQVNFCQCGTCYLLVVRSRSSYYCSELPFRGAPGSRRITPARHLVSLSPGVTFASRRINTKVVCQVLAGACMVMLS
jgi:hypothetical protein